MQCSFDVCSSVGSYTVLIAPGASGELETLADDMVVIGDAYFADTLGRGHPGQLLAAVDGLPQTLDQVAPDALMTAFSANKQHRRDVYAVVVTETGAVESLFVDRDAITGTLVRQAFTVSGAECRELAADAGIPTPMPVAIQMAAG